MQTMTRFDNKRYRRTISIWYGLPDLNDIQLFIGKVFDYIIGALNYSLAPLITLSRWLPLL